MIDEVLDTIIVGDCLEVMRGWPDACVHCCVTSPPYWGLRSYLPDAVMLRGDLTDGEREHVVAELARLDIHTVDSV